MTAVSRYKRDQVVTANGPKLMVMLFHKARAEMLRGKDSLKQKDPRGAESALSHAVDIVLELKSTLDPEKSPALCQQLDSLYAFVLLRLFEARRLKSIAKVEEAERVFAPIADAFAEAVAAQR
jgi:flagellar protein FliS